MTPALSWNPPRQDLGKPHLLGQPWCWHLLQHKLLRDISKPHLLGLYMCLWQEVAISWP